MPVSTKVVSRIAIDASTWICTKQRKSGGGNEAGTFTSFSVGMDESEVPFFEVKSAGQVEVGENGIQQIPRYLDAVGHNATTASSILAGTSLVKVSILEKDGVCAARCQRGNGNYHSKNVD